MLVNPRHQDDVEFTGRYRLSVVDFSKELKIVEKHIVRATPEEERRILAEVAPCIGVEHRHGICPCGLNHVRDIEGNNTVVQSIKASIVNQCVGIAATNLLVTYIAAGTSAAATTAGLTQLVTEFVRVTPSDLIPLSALQWATYWFFNASTGNAGSDLQEWGIMAGGATGVAATGTMIARFLQAYTKNNLNTLSGQYTFTVN